MEGRDGQERHKHKEEFTLHVRLKATTFFLMFIAKSMLCTVEDQGEKIGKILIEIKQGKGGRQATEEEKQRN